MIGRRKEKSCRVKNTVKVSPATMAKVKFTPTTGMMSTSTLVAINMRGRKRDGLGDDIETEARILQPGRAMPLKAQ